MSGRKSKEGYSGKIVFFDSLDGERQSLFEKIVDIKTLSMLFLNLNNLYTSTGDKKVIDDLVHASLTTMISVKPISILDEKDEKKG